MEFLVFIIVIISALASSGKKKKAQQEKMKQAFSDLKTQFYTVSSQESGSGSSAFSQVRRQGTKAVFPQSDPGRVNVQRVSQPEPNQFSRQENRSASAKDSPLMRKTVTQRERFERSSAYETSNRMDVRYTSNGCGCTTGKGNAAYGSSHGRTNAMYDEARFFKESREICSGKWS